MYTIIGIVLLWLSNKQTAIRSECLISFISHCRRCHEHRCVGKSDPSEHRRDSADSHSAKRNLSCSPKSKRRVHKIDVVDSDLLGQTQWLAKNRGRCMLAPLLRAHLNCNCFSARAPFGAVSPPCLCAKMQSELTCAICGFLLRSFKSRAFASIECNRLHRITPSRSVKASTRISESCPFALWSGGMALHRVSQAAHSRHKSSGTIDAILCAVFAVHAHTIYLLKFEFLSQACAI